MSPLSTIHHSLDNGHTMTQQDPPPKLHIDSDWKAEAQAEKERLVAEEQARSQSKPSAKRAGPGDLPEASFRSLCGLLVSQALMGLGTMEDPQSGGIVVDLEGSRFAIDLLDVLEEKTKGNLDAEEATELRQLLAELRSRFVQISQLVAQQAARPGGPGAGPGAGAGPAAGPGLAGLRTAPPAP
jgi:hypothetical protein